MSAGSERSYATPAAVLAGLSRGSGPSVSGGGAAGSGRSQAEGGTRRKPPFPLAADDTKPVLRDPISRSDPVETEQAVLRLPPFP
ncbi:hypothetical protein D1007_22262 [Hordeum vulgare]|uniref:Uncharacterized protein n=1 Tax=Hordeum vulgare subsp. vulgare TaxID=112509 RepID=A0A8I6X1D3_HORVV|nr:uncharacterized protein LOC123424552 [Hordeum vulgare subsp. vulgare]XP_044964118.1 uncharacterized protein LOC123424552 [Hordeum vulgare subsp. vulgare]KAE8801999.1 hypothetical protein D1007_22262 [Hordeum vulgare]KAI4968188.1 hypothetical protein ZWY2020_005300 [Hordeum vulgare]